MAKVSKQHLPPTVEPVVDHDHGAAGNAYIQVHRRVPSDVQLARSRGQFTVEIGLDAEIHPQRELTLARLEDILRRHVSGAGDCRTTFVIFQIMADRAALLEPQLERLLNQLTKADKLKHCQGVTFYSVLVAPSRLADTTARLDEIVGPGELTENVIIDMAEQWRRRAEE